jgi:hypothetical protein
LVGRNYVTEISRDTTENIVLDIVTAIEKSGLEWKGYLEKLDHGSEVRKYLTVNRKEEE